MTINKDHSVYLLGISILLFVFFKNIWLCDDAHAYFRFLEQLFSGNGPRWNPHDRVQVFTSALWLWVLAFFRLFIKDFFIYSSLVSLIFFINFIYFSIKTIKQPFYWLLFMCLLVLCNGYFDYTTSGLETSLIFFLISIYAYLYLKINSTKYPQKDLTYFFILNGALLLTRHDLASLIAIPSTYIFFKNFKRLSIKQWVFLFLISISPLLMWSIFSIIYYGVPLPNTAYAKLSIDVPAGDLLSQGLNYFYYSLHYDSLFFICYGAFPLILLFSKPYFKFIALGALLNFIYVIKIGGDFMQGRFISHSFLLMGLLVFTSKATPNQILNKLQLSKKFVKAEFFILFAAVFILYGIYFYHTPITSPFYYTYEKYPLRIYKGVADERGIYAKDTSLPVYLKYRRKEVANFPTHRSVDIGLEVLNSDIPVREEPMIGMAGYFMGVKKIQLDPLGLGDPLLSRLPLQKNGEWFIGHYRRAIPDGYKKSLSANKNLIEDPNIHKFYEAIRVITQDKALFSLNRWKAIYKLNTNQYDHLLDALPKPTHYKNLGKIN